jgi:thymidylate synthase
MFRLFTGNSANEIWQAANNAFRSGVGVFPQDSRSGPTLEILHAAFSLPDPKQRWVFSRTPPINIAFAIAEVVWIMAGRNDAQFLNYFNRQLPKYAGFEPHYHGAYGHRLRLHHQGLDQLNRAYKVLSNNPDSRQVVLQIWDSRVDLPNEDGSPTAPDIPCNIAAMLKVRNGALEWTQIMRSNDLHRGLPYNLVQFTTLHEVMSGWLGIRLGTYNQLSDSLHLYKDCLELAESPCALSSVPNTDSLALPKAQSDKAFATLANHAEAISSSTFSAKELLCLQSRTDLPPAFRNLLCLLCAEGARREYSNDLANDVMRSCTNATYRTLYSLWLSRFTEVPQSTSVSRCDVRHTL